MHGSAGDRFIDVHVTIPDFYVEPAFRIGTDPSFVMYWRALTTKIGQGHEVSFAAFNALRHRILHRFLLPSLFVRGSISFG